MRRDRPVVRMRPATEADVEAMHRVRMSVRENRLSDPSRVQPHHTLEMLRERGRGWMAEAGGEVVGFAVGDRSRSNVWALFVDPEHEGRGIGRRLHDAMLDWFFEAETETVWLSTDPGTRAETFYRAAGWAPAGFEPNGELRFEMSRERWLSGPRTAGGRGRGGPSTRPSREEGPMFRTEGIDHVALAVRDVLASAAWYEEVLGLRRVHQEVWGDFPALVGTGTTAVALFPVVGDPPKPRPGRDTIAMRHLAFRVDRANFTAAKAALSGRGIPFTEQHHDIAESIYFFDPDGHELEITTYELASPASESNERSSPGGGAAEGARGG